MKKRSYYIALLTCLIVIDQGINAMPDSDSLPACIVQMKEKNLRLKTDKYEYKGQYWYTITKDTAIKIENYPDRINYIKFYDQQCQLVCTWTKGGIAGFNKVAPDTIEKEKIKKIIPVTNDTIKQLPTASLPDTISKIGIYKNANYIYGYNYDGIPVFLVIPLTLPAYQLAQKGIATTDEFYYDGSGKLVATFKRATNSMFLRAQQWQPSTFKSNLLTKKLNKEWVKAGNGYTMLK